MKRACIAEASKQNQNTCLRTRVAVERLVLDVIRPVLVQQTQDLPPLRAFVTNILH